MKLKIFGLGATILSVLVAIAQTNNIIDEVAWVIGDEAIFKSEANGEIWKKKDENSVLKNNTRIFKY